MKKIIILIGALMCLAGISLIVSPSSIFQFIENNLDQSWLFILAIIARILLGVLLLVLATQSKYPMVIKIFGIITVLAGLSFLFMGHDRFENFLSFILSNTKPYLFVGGVAAILFGVFLIHAFTGDHRIKSRS